MTKSSRSNKKQLKIAGTRSFDCNRATTSLKSKRKHWLDSAKPPSCRIRASQNSMTEQTPCWMMRTPSSTRSSILLLKWFPQRRIISQDSCFSDYMMVQLLMKAKVSVSHQIICTKTLIIATNSTSACQSKEEPINKSRSKQHLSMTRVQACM